MKVVVIGSGNMGSGLVKQFALAGHDVSVAGRDAAKAAKLAAANGARVADAGSVAASDVVVVATAYPDAVAALRAVGNVAGKTVVDITNPLSADYMSLTLGHSTSAAEEIAKAFPAAHVVKAFNTIFAQVLANGSKLANGDTVQTFVAGDDAGAKAQVTALAASAGFKVVDAGGLKNARYLEPLAGLNIYFGYGAGLGTTIAPAWLNLQ